MQNLIIFEYENLIEYLTISTNPKYFYYSPKYKDALLESNSFHYAGSVILNFPNRYEIYLNPNYDSIQRYATRISSKILDLFGPDIISANNDILE